MRSQRTPVGAPDGRGGPWVPYVPSVAVPWDMRRVVHLRRRAGFAAPWAELERDLADGPEVSVSRLLAGHTRSPISPDDFRRVSGLLADSALAARDPSRLKAWWVYRMLFGPDPLGERLTLLWHNYFATSNLKVNDLATMRRQNELFREFARAPFGELLRRAARDPALLVWLDAPANRKGHPNENLARELMELFTLGIGHYTEGDVKEAARALTGWTVIDGQFHEIADRHDVGEKTILRRKGRWAGEDLVRVLLDEPATAHRLASRICEHFMGEGAIDAVAVNALADGLQAHHLDIGWAVTTVLRSWAFFAGANLGSRVLGPVEFVVGACRALEILDPPPSTAVLADWIARLGQDLFYPPDVGGWPGGRAWLSTRTLVGRANFAATLSEGPGIGRPQPLDAVALLQRHGRGSDRQDAISFSAQLLRGNVPGPGWRDRITATLVQTATSEAEAARRAVSLVLASPELQLC